MANYILGSLKIRGNVDKAIEFLNSTINGCSFYFDDDNQLQTTFLADDFGYFKDSIETKIETTEIKGFESLGIAYICFDEVGCRRNFETKYFLAKSQEYGLDFRYHGFESNRGVNHVIEIIGGKVIWDDEIEFRDYFWECLYPFKG